MNMTDLSIYQRDGFSVLFDLVGILMGSSSLEKSNIGWGLAWLSFIEESKWLNTGETAIHKTAKVSAGLASTLHALIAQLSQITIRTLSWK